MGWIYVMIPAQNHQHVTQVSVNGSTIGNVTPTLPFCIVVLDVNVESENRPRVPCIPKPRLVYAT